MKRFSNTRMLDAVKASPYRPIGRDVALLFLAFGIGTAVQGLCLLLLHLCEADIALVRLVSLFATAATVVACLVFCLKIQKRSLLSLGLSGKDAAAEYAVGLGIGFFMLSLTVLVCVLTGSLTLSVTDRPSVLMLILFFLAFMVQGFSEELFCRACLMLTLSRGAPLWVCVLGNSLFFAFLHAANPGITPLAFLNLTLFGVFASFYTLRRGSIQGIAAVHTAWNFAQGNLFGISVSGMDQSPSLLTSSAADGAQHHLLHGGTFGPEAGLPVTAVMLIGIGILWLCPTKKSELQP